MIGREGTFTLLLIANLSGKHRLNSSRPTLFDPESLALRPFAKTTLSAFASFICWNAEKKSLANAQKLHFPAGWFHRTKSLFCFAESCKERQITRVLLFSSMKTCTYVGIRLWTPQWQRLDTALLIDTFSNWCISMPTRNWSRKQVWSLIWFFQQSQLLNCEGWVWRVW